MSAPEGQARAVRRDPRDQPFCPHLQSQPPSLSGKRAWAPEAQTASLRPLHSTGSPQGSTWPLKDLTSWPHAPPPLRPLCQPAYLQDPPEHSL